MAPQLNNEGEKQKNVDQEEVRESISALTRRLGAIRRSDKSVSLSSHSEDDEEEVSIITLTGSNVGATMRGAMDDKAVSEEEDSAASYAVNSNFQAVNNSVMLGGSLETNDPGVHLDITDGADQNDAVAKNGKKARKGRRGAHRHVQLSDNVSDADTHKN